MGVQKVTQSIQSKGLGRSKTPTLGVFAILANSSSGPPVPVRFAGRQIDQLIATFGQGIGVQRAALSLAKGHEIVFLRLPNTTHGGAGTDGADLAVTFTGTGTSVVTLSVDGGVGAYDDGDWIVKFTAGQTIGVAGIKFQYSSDAGRTWSPILALGTANLYTIPNSGITLHFAAGTIVALDQAVFFSKAPKWAAADLPAATAALQSSFRLKPFDKMHVVGACSATEAAAVKTMVTTLESAAIYVRALTDARRPNPAESEATWSAAVETDYAAFTSERMGVGAGLDWLVSPIAGDGSTKLRPISWDVALRIADKPIHISASKVADGPLDGEIVDSSDNKIAHDESQNPGLDDARFITATTYPHLDGVYCTRPNLMAAAGSDFTEIQLGAVMDLACTVAFAELMQLLSLEVQREKRGARAGKIAETDRARIQEHISSVLRSKMVKPGYCVDAGIVISGDDDLTATPPVISSETWVEPLGYIEGVNNVLRFTNQSIEAKVG